LKRKLVVYLNRKQSHYIQLDLIVILILLMTVSLLAIFNAQQLGQYQDNFVLRQVIFFGIGILILVAFQILESEQLEKISVYLYIVGIVLLLLLEISPESLAESRNNAKRAFTGLPGLTLQPAELTKLAFILFLSATIHKHKQRYEFATTKSDFLLIGKILIYTVLPIIFIFQQPDLGTSIVFVFIAATMILLSGIDWKILTVVAVGSIVAIGLSLMLIVNLPELAEKVIGIKPYQIERIETWFSPEVQDSNDTYQIDLSMLAVGSGQLNGKGMSNPEVQLPEAHTDFIFSIIGESFGFIGAAGVVFLFFLLLYKLLTLGMQVLEKNPFGAYVTFGYMSLILIHTFQNIGMTIGIMPVTGIPLLFISYGGSTVLSTMIGFSIVYLIAVEHSKEGESLFS